MDGRTPATMMTIGEPSHSDRRETVVAMFGSRKDPNQEVMRHLRESIAAREYAGTVMRASGGDPAPESPEAREVRRALGAARSEHESALRVAHEYRESLDPAVLELADSYRYNPPPFRMHPDPDKPYRATIVGSLRRVWSTLDDEQRSRTHRERHEDASSPFYRGSPEPEDCPLCEDEGMRGEVDDLRQSFATMSVDQKRAVLEATAPGALAEMRRTGLVSDQDFCLLLNISTGTDADTNIDLDEYRAVLTKRLAAYSTMGPSTLIEDVESGLFQFTIEDAGVLGVMPHAALMQLMQGLATQYKRAKAMPADVRELADSLQR